MAKMAQNRADNGSPERAEYVFHLYICGATVRSQHALTNIKEICEEHLNGRYALKVVDIFQSPAEVEYDHIVAAPTLIKRNPLPVQRFIGNDLSDKHKLLLGLGISGGAA